MIFKLNKDIKAVIRSAALYREISDEEKDAFRSNVESLFSSVENSFDCHSEQTVRGFLKDFLDRTYCSGLYAITEEESRKDLSIHGSANTASPVNVFIEVKTEANRQEMVSERNLNVKAFHETILYYMREREQNNRELKHIIITNIDEWYIIDALEYDRLFWRNKAFKKDYVDWKAKKLSSATTDFFYGSIAAPYIEASKATIRCIYFKLKTHALTAQGKAKKSITHIYKILSPNFLLKQYETADNNRLNKNFYQELLHIMGLEEVKRDKKVVLCQKEADKVEEGYLIHNAINAIKDSGRIFDGGSQLFEGDSTDEKIFSAALNVTIIWINRLLFLKLLEAQLIAFNGGDKETFGFLTPDRLKSYKDVNNLFFRVLSQFAENRQKGIAEKFPRVPYLNSSLFEPSIYEKKTVFISELDNDCHIALFQKSVLAEDVRKQGITLSPLEYLLRFLDKYDFGSDRRDYREEKNHKPLISASVLGLIFEKINGYKDGSIFTPSYITTGMARRTIRHAVLNKFNAAKGWSCPDLIEVYNKIHGKNKEISQAEACQIMGSIRICDPAVGSGHFLVSALNELIVIKSELDLIADENGRSLGNYSISAPFDELIIVDSDGTEVKYRPSVNYKESQRVQEVIFNEKRQFIENCLFGVDINPNSVNICRLRLWIELLKSTYYDRADHRLRTLPNIDINIKCGNSLLHRFSMSDSSEFLKAQLEKVGLTLEEYKSKVARYRETNDKNEKRQIEEVIAQLKASFRDNVLPTELMRKHLILEKQLADNFQEQDLFEKKTDAEMQAYKELRGRLKMEKKKLEEYRSNPIFKQGIEWRLEFPDILDEKGDFVGFDCIIGNPPYMRIQKISDSQTNCKDYYHEAYSEMTEGNYDLANLFVKLAIKISSPHAVNSFILPHKFLNSSAASSFRDYLMENRFIRRLIHFGANLLFEDANTYTCIIEFLREPSEGLDYYHYRLKGDYRHWGNEDTIHIPYKDIKEMSGLYRSNQWILFDKEIERRIFRSIYRQDGLLSDKFPRIIQGIATGKDDLYIFSGVEDGDYIRGHFKGSEEMLIERAALMKYIKGQDIHRYSPVESNLYILFPYQYVEGRAVIMKEDEIKRMYPNAYSWYKSKEGEHRRKDKDCRNSSEWYKYARNQGLNITEDRRLVSMEICSSYPNVTVDESKVIHSSKVYSWIKAKDSAESYKTLLAVANSNLLWWFLKITGDTMAGDARTLKTSYLNPFPMPKKMDAQVAGLLEEKVDEMMQAKKKQLDSSQIEYEINRLVCDIYHLDEESSKYICDYV